MSTRAFFTDSTLCIGCKACEVACKEWNDVPADGYVWTGHSYDNTGGLGHSTWRHVKFVEHLRDGAPAWDFSSDVCKHCENAGCLEACPTGSIVRTEFGGVYIQPDVCNGCGYCVVACPFGVVDRRPDDGRAFKCTFCYDRQKAGLEPACAKACPTQSIQFGDLDDLRAKAAARLDELHARGVDDAVVYDASGTSVGQTHAIFLVRGDVRTFNLPIQPVVPTTLLGTAWTSAAIAGVAAMLMLMSSRAFNGLSIIGIAVVALFALFPTGSVEERSSTFADRSLRSRLPTYARRSLRSRLRWAGRREVNNDDPVPLEDVPSYYERPLLKPPVWTWEVPLYLFTGGAAGMAAAIAGVATMFAGEPSLTIRALVVSAILAAVSPLLLISDLGRPSRFLNMLRVFKPQSPMSVGAWTLTLFTTAVFGTLLLAWLHAGVILILFLVASMLLGLVLATYTGVLIGATAVPVWSRFVRLLPVHFGASALGAAISIVELTGYHTAALNRTAIAAAALETIVGVTLETIGDPQGRALFNGPGAMLTRLGTILSGLIPLVIRTTLETSPAFRAIASIATVVGSLAARYGWITAGRHSTVDPRLAL